MAGAVPVGDLFSQLGKSLALYDYDVNRERVKQADRLRQLTASGLQRRNLLRDQLASQGMTHSGANLRAQTDLMGQMDAYKAGLNQRFQDRLADIARQRIAAEADYNITQRLPR